MGHRTFTQPTHKAKQRMKVALGRQRIKQERQKRKLAKRRGEVKECLPLT